ncbi:hypothetical protein QJS83_11175 [Bdellovibrio sp. 22V]|uniref:hypothetical protein n=1 Tax=Bdellovibrio sp. 22V TaxID=3044166 RepID=UPI00254310AA|nr:hypothetical protein [Bdellovibrio sp. 22V]WII71023.1 hypothetical protein QJS83_11175 [Bdellovibrio sp. 22V]
MLQTAEAKRATEWALHIDTKLEATYFPQDIGDNTNRDLYKLELDPNYLWKYKDNFRFYSKLTFVANPNNNSDEEKYFFDVTEGYFRYTGETYSLQAGANIFTWGVTDGYNPVDIVNQKQYFDPLHSRKLGSLSMVFSQTLGNWEYELIYIPRSREAILPGTESRWLPREVYVPYTPENDLVLLLPETLRYHYGTKESLDNALDNNGAFRVQRRGDVFDIGLSFYEGVASFPIVQPVVTGTIVAVSPKTIVQVDPDVTLNTKNYRLRQGGLTLTATFWEMLFKYASAYSQSIGDDPLLPGWTHENVAALEKNFPLGDKGFLIGVLQYSLITSERANDSNLSVTEIFREAWMLGGRMTWKEVWNYSLLGLYDQKHGSNFIEASIGRRFFDRWVLTFTADFIQGSQETPLGVYENNDSYTLSLSASF